MDYRWICTRKRPVIDNESQRVGKKAFFTTLIKIIQLPGGSIYIHVSSICIEDDDLFHVSRVLEFYSPHRGSLEISGVHSTSGRAGKEFAKMRNISQAFSNPVLRIRHQIVGINGLG